MSGSRTCRRCGHPNETRARFCAQCGLRLLDAADPLERVVKANGRKTGRTIVLLLLFGAMALAALNVSLAARYARHRRCIFAPPPPTRVLHEDNCSVPNDAGVEPSQILRIRGESAIEFPGNCPAEIRCPYVRQMSRCPYLHALSDRQCPFLRSYRVRPERTPRDQSARVVAYAGAE